MRGGFVGCFVSLVFIVVVVFVIASSKGVVGDFDKLVSSGTPARGILLKVASTGTPAGTSGLRRFERRSVFIDIEIPGQPPFELSANPLIPSNLVRDVLPGATVELRIDPARRNIAIVGPGVALAAAGFLPPGDDQILSTQLAAPTQGGALPPRKS